MVDVQDISDPAAAAAKDDQQLKQMKTSRSEPQLKKMKLDRKTVVRNQFNLVIITFSSFDYH